MNCFFRNKKEGIAMQGIKEYPPLKEFIIRKILFSFIPLIIISLTCLYEIYELDLLVKVFDRDNVQVWASLDDKEEYTKEESYEHYVHSYILKYNYKGEQYDNVIDGDSWLYDYCVRRDRDKLRDNFQIYVNKNNPSNIYFPEHRPVRDTGYGIIIGIVAAITFLKVIVEIITRIQLTIQRKKNLFSEKERISSFDNSPEARVAENFRRRFNAQNCRKSRSIMIISVIIFLIIDIIFAGVKIGYFNRQLAYDMVIANVDDVVSKTIGDDENSSTIYIVSISYTYKNANYHRKYTTSTSIEYVQTMPVFINPDNSSDYSFVKRDEYVFMMLLWLNVIPVVAFYSSAGNKDKLKSQNARLNSNYSTDYEFYKK